MTPAEGNKEWKLLKQQFDELVLDEGSGAVDLFDAEFQIRFAELMNRVCSPSKYYQKADPFPHGS
jgi:hypothetical protein